MFKPNAMGGGASKAPEQRYQDERFKHLDQDNSSTISVTELKAVLKTGWTTDRIRKLIDVFDDEKQGELTLVGWRRACTLLSDVVEKVGGHIETHHEEECESKLREELRSFVPIAKHAKVLAQTDACASLEADVSKEPTSAGAKEALRKHTEDKLQPAINAAIDELLRTKGILGKCDKAIVAGMEMDDVYTSVFKTITGSEKEQRGLKQLANELDDTTRAVNRAGVGRCVQKTDNPVELFADAARVRSKAREALDAVVANANGARLEKQGPLKKMGRIVEKVRWTAQLFCPRPSLTRTHATPRRSRCVPATAAAAPSACATLCATCVWQTA